LIFEGNSDMVKKSRWKSDPEMIERMNWKHMASNFPRHHKWTRLPILGCWAVLHGHLGLPLKIISLYTVQYTHAQLKLIHVNVA